ncbi:MAG TPA: hypothetical protein PLC52_04705 [Anaerolineales bacterium]|nr:hypothetical protein [Anaerolineales bacterium]HRQ92149.1 hypothetical protein [Anaerolineales bacterium]
MKISYFPTFEQFADNYLATYYGGGVQTLRRAASGPLIMLLGSLIIVVIFDRSNSLWLRLPAVVVGLYVFWRGLATTLGPLFNVFLVYLRREQLFGPQAPATTMSLRGKTLSISQGGEKVSIPVDHIQSVQYRAESTWLLTHSDQMLYIPREGLESGNHDAFVARLEKALAAKGSKA